MKRQKGPIIVFTALLLSFLIPCIITPPANGSASASPGMTQAEKTVRLTVTVRDEGNNLIGGARVNVYLDRTLTPDFLRDTLPADFQEDTNARGVATIEIRIREGSKLRFILEVGRDGLQTKKEVISLGTNFPPDISKDYVLTAKSGNLAGDTIKVGVNVINDNFDLVEGARVLIRDSAQGGFGGERYQGVTGREGQVIIPIQFTLKKVYTIEVSKEGHKQGKKFLELDRHQIGKTVFGGDITIEKAAGIAVTITVTDQASNLSVADADVILDGAGYYTATTDGSGTATFFVRETGSFAVRISQDHYEAFQSQARLLEGENSKALSFAVKAKVKKADGPASVEVTVLQGDRVERLAGYNLPLPAATVSVGANTSSTNSSGKATISGDFEGNVEVVVEASGYKRQSRTVRLSAKQRFTGGIAAVTFLMQPESSEDAIEVSVFTVGKSAGAPVPLAGATVRVGDETATTNASGRAKLTGKFEDSVEVAVEKNGYLRQARSVNASGGKGTASFTLQPQPDEDSVSITVMAQDPKGGSPSAIAGARVSANGLTAATDRSGKATITGNFKDGVEVIAQANGFDSQTRQVSITQPARTGSVSFLLQPEPPALRLVVEVRDSAAPNNPIPGAQVDVHLPVEGTPPLAKRATDNRGEASFELKGAADQLATMRSGLRLAVSFETKKAGQHAKIAYFAVPSDIAKSLLENSTEARRVTVFLERDWSFLRVSINWLEGRSSTLNKEAGEAARKIQSVLDLATKSPAARGRAESALNEMKKAYGIFMPARVQALQSCELKESIQSFQKEAAAKEKQLNGFLQEAQTLAASCTTSATADRISSGYRTAIKLAGEIGAIGTKAMNANQQIKRQSEVMKEAGPLKRQLQQVRDQIETELTAAKENASKANADYNRALTLSKELGFRRSQIQADLDGLTSEYEATNNYSPVPRDLTRRLNGVAQQLGSYNNDVSFGAAPDADRRDVVRETVTVIEDYKKQADAITGDMLICELQPMDDAVDEIRMLVTNSSFKLGLAADLPNKAAECVKRGACTPVIGEVRALIQSGSFQAAETKLNQARAQGCDLSALPGGASLLEELDYYKTVNEAVAILKTAQSNCKFQEAINWAAQIPESIRSRPSIANALTEIQAALVAQKRIQQLRISARDAVARGNTNTAADPLIRQAERFAAPYPCLLEEVSRFRSEYPATRRTDQPPTDDVPGALGDGRARERTRTKTAGGNITPTDEVPGALGSGAGRPPVRGGAGSRPGGNAGGTTGGSGGTSTGSGGKPPRPCTATEIGLFNKMTGSWKSIAQGPNITIGGSCEQASGTITYREYCERPDATYNTTLKLYEVTLTGRMEGGGLQVEYKRPGTSDPNSQKGTGSCQVGNDGNLSCGGLPCNVNAKKQ